MLKMKASQCFQPVRRSLFDVLRDNLRKASRVSYAHRLIYVGDHTFPPNLKKNLGELMEKSINAVNNEYHTERLTGILLHYPRYFCHMVEGCERCIIKHLKFILEHQKLQEYLGTMKLLVCYHHINQRVLPNWIAITGKPQTLLEKIDTDLDMEHTARHVFNVVQKMYKLVLFEKEEMERLTQEKVEINKTSRGSRVTESIPDCLPEYGLIEFLIASSHVPPIQYYYNMFGVVPPLISYRDLVWPCTPEFVPYNLFDQPFDPITDLPTVGAHEENTA